MTNRPVLIGISGGTGSGKSTVTKAILQSLSEKNIAIIQQDSYYKDHGHLSLDERRKINYDHPFAFDTELLVKHLKLLLKNIHINKPIYDFENYIRKESTEIVEPRDIIILEGILIFEDYILRNMLDIKIFVDTDPDVRVIRRIMRDINKRARTLESVVEQYLKTVRPAHLQFVEPNKKYADIIIPEGGFNQIAIDIITTKIQAILNERK